ncbi:AbiJ-NTD4 domain-containing protein [Peribacillus butanolivorans]|uniref:AbiJ-NTD4 domain-containing protein n=1 Tax=Peribacillus butanolivorans TaxID=421767 RepID=UPI0036DA8E4A
MRFSERMGYRQVKDVIQHKSMDEDLKNGLWNALWDNYLKDYGQPFLSHLYRPLVDLTISIWKDFFKEPIDNVQFGTSSIVEEIRSFFLYEGEWDEIYDLVEFIPNHFSLDTGVNEKFINDCNVVLEREASAYRFVGKQLAEITTNEEIQEIEDAITNPSTNSLVKTHISNALSLMADREKPDYRNSIKESISAVECVAKAIVKNPKTTLGAALNAIESNGTIEFHADLKDGFKKIYHYTSDSAGIRHALKDQSTVNFEDAKFMLVSCSTFCNYLTVKASKAGIIIS